MASLSCLVESLIMVSRNLTSYFLIWFHCQFLSRTGDEHWLVFWWYWQIYLWFFQSLNFCGIFCRLVVWCCRPLGNVWWKWVLLSLSWKWWVISPCFSCIYFYTQVIWINPAVTLLTSYLLIAFLNGLNSKISPYTLLSQLLNGPEYKKHKHQFH